MLDKTSSAAPDTDPRRMAIADALLRVVARSGMDAVSMRVVAAEAGCSLGMVQRLAGTRDDLLALGMDRVVERVDARIAAAGLDEGQPPQAFLRQLVDVLLIDGHREEGVVWATFFARALVTPELAPTVRRQQEEAHAAVLLVLQAALAGGDLAPGVDPERETLALLALADGLGLQLLLGRIDGDAARAAAHAHLDRLFSHAAPPA